MNRLTTQIMFIIKSIKIDFPWVCRLVAWRSASSGCITSADTVDTWIPGFVRILSSFGPGCGPNKRLNPFNTKSFSCVLNHVLGGGQYTRYNPALAECLIVSDGHKVCVQIESVISKCETYSQGT